MPEIIYPNEDKTWKFVLHAHGRGRSLHLDLRIQIDENRLEGWTLDAIKSIPKDPANLTDFRKQVKSKLDRGFKDLLSPDVKVVSQPKALEPYEWLNINNTTFPIGTVGATKYKKGYMFIIDKGIVEHGVKKPNFFEYFIHGDKISGRMIFRQLENVWRQKAVEEDEKEKTGRGYTVWMSFFADPPPYAISDRAVKEKWYPPTGISSLPKKIRVQIPGEFQYWKKRDEEEAKKIRDELVNQIKEKQIVLKYSEIEIFAKTKFGPPVYPHNEPQVDKMKVPSTIVYNEVMTTLFYKPSPELRFRWVSDRYGRSADCPDCKWLAENSPYTIETLPTIPKEGHTFCKEKCECAVDVVFPDGHYYEFLPVKNGELYESPWVVRWMIDLLYEGIPEADGPMPLWTRIMDELQKNRDTLAAMIVDFKNMDRLDKAFIVFAGQPLIKDWYVAARQATKEIYLAEGITEKEAMALGIWNRAAIQNKIRTVTIRLVSEGQVQEVEKQAGLMEDFLLEVITSLFLQPVTRYMFRGTVAGVKKIKDFTNKAEVGPMVTKAIKDTEMFLWSSMEKRIGTDLKIIERNLMEIREWGLDAGRILLKIVDVMVQFWKHCVLIFAPGVAVRNIADNFVKSVNEMLNSFFKGEPFWAFFFGKKVRLLDIPKEVAKARFSDDVVSIGEMETFLGKTVAFWNVCKNTLYDFLLVKPEQWFRKGLYAGKLARYEKDLIAVGKNPQTVEEFRTIKKLAIDEVNRVFFDYSKKMSLEVPAARLFPFVKFNTLNTIYWLHDFFYYPWKLSAINSVWNYWLKTTEAEIEFKLKDKIPFFLIPGLFFNPLAWSSANDFIKVFAMYKGEPKWFTAREKHLEWQAKHIRSLPSEKQYELLQLREYKGVQDYMNKQKYSMVRVTVEFLDTWLGLFPVWKKILAHFHLAEKEEYKKIFPQGPLVDALTSSMFNTFYGSVKPPSSQTVAYIFKIMKTEGTYYNPQILYKPKVLPNLSAMTVEEAKTVVSKYSNDPEALMQFFDEERKGKNRETLIEYILGKINHLAADKVYRAWEVQKIVIGYFTGMYLTKSWKEVYNMHVNQIEQLEPEPAG